MNKRMYVRAALAACVLPFFVWAVDLADLINPDDVMLRKPTQKTTAQRNAEEAKVAEAAKEDVERRFQEAKAAAEKAQAEAAAKAQAEVAAKMEAERKAAAEKAQTEAAAQVEAARKAAAAKAQAEAAAKVEAERKAAAEKAQAEIAAKAELDRQAAERALAAKAEAERRAAAEKKAANEARAQAEADKKAADEALAKAAAERRAAAEKADAELRQLREQVAAEKAAREKAEADRTAAERAKTNAEAEKKEAEAAMGLAVQKVRDEREARERAEAGQAAAEAKADAEKRAAEKAVEKAEKAKESAEKRAAYLANPDPDERPAPKKKLVAAGDDSDVADGQKTAAKRPPKKQLTGRAAVITADRTDYDRKEGVILFDRNVYVDDEQYQMHAERMFVFLDGTNDLKRLVALGGVSITNEEKSASCQKAVYTKTASKIVMYGDEKNPAWLRDAGGKPGDESEVRGRRITYWLDTGLATVEGSVITVPGLKGSNSPKELFGAGFKKDKDK